MKINIRPEQLADYEQITQINDLAFGQPTEGRLVEQIRQLPDFIPELSLVAELDGQIIGYILFSLVQVVADNGNHAAMLCLAPLAVLPEFQNKNVGTSLVKEGLKRAKAMGYESVNVLGHKDYYPRFGFRPASHWGISTPFKVPDEVFMAMELVEGSLKKVSGVIQYSEPFKEF